MAASRTPEGFPSRCPACDATIDLDALPAGKVGNDCDTRCPACGALLRKSNQLAESVRVAIAGALGVPREALDDEHTLGRVAVDSLETVEAVMAVEDAIDGFRFSLRDEALKEVQSVHDLVRLVLQSARDD